MKQATDFSAQFNRIQRIALGIGIVGVVVSIAGLFFNSEQFFQSYLVGFIFWLQLSAGSVFILAIHYLVSGRWGAVIQRILEAGSATLPLMMLLAIPLLFALPTLYVWARPDVVAHDALLQHKVPYLNVPFFVFRVLGYLVIWSAIAYLYRQWSNRRDRTGDMAIHDRLKTFSGPATVVMGLTVTFASFDWMMSLEPHWFSTIYGIIFGVGAGASAFAFATIVLSLVKDDSVFKGKLHPLQFNDLGNFLLTMVVLWAYVELSQFLIIWLGNLKEEIPWYLARSANGWNGVAFVLVLFHFGVPFLFLLLRNNKRHYGRVAAIAWLIFVMRFVDLYWFITPAFKSYFTIHWLDFSILFGIGGLWIALFVSQLGKRSLLPQFDPRLEEEVPHGQPATSESF